MLKLIPKATFLSFIYQKIPQKGFSFNNTYSIILYMKIFIQKLKTFCLLILFFAIFFPLKSPSAYAATRPSFSGYFFYYGDLHAHSGYSNDGAGAPEQAYDSAKSNKNDFFALTEHDEAFSSNPYLCLNGVDNSQAGTPNFTCAQKIYIGTTQKWENLKQIALQKTVPNEFIALYGFEWTHSGGHLNVFEAPNFIAPPFSLESFYNYLNSHPNKNSLFVQFNHPTQSFDFRLPVNNPDPNSIFTYSPAVASVATLVETNQFAANYPKALKNGYRVGATGYGDGHLAFSAGSRRYGVIAPSLTKESLISALKNHQTFGVLDGRTGSQYFPLALALKINNTLMGGNTPFNGAIQYEVYVRDDFKNIDQLELRYGGNYSTDYYLLATFNNLGKEKIISGSFSNFAFGMPNRAKFVYAVVKQKNSSGAPQEVAWSSPVWINYNSNYNPTPTPQPTTPTPTLTPTAAPTSTPCPPVATPTHTPTVKPPTITPTPTPTPTPTSSLICQSTCYYGQSQCQYKATPIPGYSCALNLNCPGCDKTTKEWCWSYCKVSSPLPTLTPTPATPTPTPTLIQTPTPTTPSAQDCKPTCYYGQSQCKYRVTPIPGYSCALNFNCPGCDRTTGNWCWAYCKQ